MAEENQQNSNTLKVAFRRNFRNCRNFVKNNNVEDETDWLAKYVNPGCQTAEVIFYKRHLIIRPSTDKIKVDYSEIIGCSIEMPDMQKLEAKSAELRTNDFSTLVHIEGGGERTRDVFSFNGLIGKIMRLVRTGNL
ncbi:MAG: hypothetical protein PVF65_03260 [Sphingomonadales bacterium]|jgi:hypothetical protein